MCGHDVRNTGSLVSDRLTVDNAKRDETWVLGKCRHTVAAGFIGPLNFVIFGNWCTFLLQLAGLKDLERMLEPWEKQLGWESNATFIAPYLCELHIPWCNISISQSPLSNIRDTKRSAITETSGKKKKHWGG